MKVRDAMIVGIVGGLLASLPVRAEPPSAFGSGFDVKDFYRAFSLDEITPANQQTWPYYKYVSAHWDDYALHGTSTTSRSRNPVRLTVAEGDERLDMNAKWKDGQTFIESLVATQVKGFVVHPGGNTAVGPPAHARDAKRTLRQAQNQDRAED